MISSDPKVPSNSVPGHTSRIVLVAGVYVVSRQDEVDPTAHQSLHHDAP
jgi:hypothetical protein